MINDSQLQGAFDAFDDANAQDPNAVSFEGSPVPKCLLHAQRATAWLDRVAPKASSALKLAVRAHHLERWKVPRSSHPAGRAGYLAWRRFAQDAHADRAREILLGAAIDDATTKRVTTLLRKRKPSDEFGTEEAQCFEDVLCLVFLEQELNAFAKTVSNEKLEAILRKTLPKMSVAAITHAVALPLEPAHRQVLEKLLADRPSVPD